MNTNEMIGAIIVGLGTIGSVTVLLVKPIINTAKVMQELTDAIVNLTNKFNSFEVNNHSAHKRIWEHNDEQDSQINSHETRITLLENEVGKNDN